MTNQHLVKCLFCNQEIPGSGENICRCKQCAEANDLEEVFTFYYDVGKKLEGYKFKLKLSNGYFYDVFTRIDKFKTDIYIYNEEGYYVEKVHLPGNPINLQNVKKKLPLYMLFS